MSAQTPGDGKSQNIPIKWVADDHDALKESGVACWRRREGEVRGIAWGCPCGCGEHYIPVVKGPHPQTEGFGPWGWDGNEISPTLTPSLLNNQARGACGWHGHLVAGVWTPTDDRCG